MGAPRSAARLSARLQRELRLLRGRENRRTPGPRSDSAMDSTRIMTAPRERTHSRVGRRPYHTVPCSKTVVNVSQYWTGLAVRRGTVQGFNSIAGAHLRLLPDPTGATRRCFRCFGFASVEGFASVRVHLRPSISHSSTNTRQIIPSHQIYHYDLQARHRLSSCSYGLRILDCTGSKEQASFRTSDHLSLTQQHQEDRPLCGI